jgi:hypothetical protein
MTGMAGDVLRALRVDEYPATRRFIVGWARPAPWLLAALLVAILSVLWFFAVFRFLGADAWGDESSPPESAVAS